MPTRFPHQLDSSPSFRSSGVANNRSITTSQSAPLSILGRNADDEGNAFVARRQQLSPSSLSFSHGEPSLPRSHDGSGDASSSTSSALSSSLNSTMSKLVSSWRTSRRRPESPVEPQQRRKRQPNASTGDCQNSQYVNEDHRDDGNEHHGDACLDSAVTDDLGTHYDVGGGNHEHVSTCYRRDTSESTSPSKEITGYYLSQSIRVSGHPCASVAGESFHSTPNGSLAQDNAGTSNDIPNDTSNDTPNDISHDVPTGNRNGSTSSKTNDRNSNETREKNVSHEEHKEQLEGLRKFGDGYDESLLLISRSQESDSSMSVKQSKQLQRTQQKNIKPNQPLGLPPDQQLQQNLQTQPYPEQNEGGTGKHRFHYYGSPHAKQWTPGSEEDERVMDECSFFYDENSNNNYSNLDIENQCQLKNHPLHDFPHCSPQLLESNEPYSNKSGKYSRTVMRSLQKMAKHHRQQQQHRTHRLCDRNKHRPRYHFNDNCNPRYSRSLSLEYYTRFNDATMNDGYLSPHHRQSFLAAHMALNEKLDDRPMQAKAVEEGYECARDMEETFATEEEEIRADLTKSSLLIRGGQIRLPTDNVRLVMDTVLQPGILSVETLRTNTLAPSHPTMHQCRHSTNDKETPWRNGLAYVLTVDEHLYQRVVKEMGDSHQIPCGMYYCCHEVEGGVTAGSSHGKVGIGVAVFILLVIFLFLVVCMLIWPVD